MIIVLVVELEVFPSWQSTITPDVSNKDKRDDTLMGFSFRYGGSPSTISIAMIPRLHISTLAP